jgi:hypothetical protein
MKVKDLIAILSKQDPDKEIFIQHNANPFDGVSTYLKEPMLAEMTDDKLEDFSQYLEDGEFVPVTGMLYLSSK